MPISILIHLRRIRPGGGRYCLAGTQGGGRWFQSSARMRTTKTSPFGSEALTGKTHDATGNWQDDCKNGH